MNDTVIAGWSRWRWKQQDVREAAGATLMSQKPRIAVEVRDVREKGRRIIVERLHAIGLLSRIEPEQCTSFLKERLEIESAKKVRGNWKNTWDPECGTDGNDERYEDGLTAPAPMAFAVDYSFSPERRRISSDRGAFR